MSIVTVTTEQVHELIQQLAAQASESSITPELVANIFEKLRQLNDQERAKVIAAGEAYIAEIRNTGISAEKVEYGNKSVAEEIGDLQQGGQAVSAEVAAHSVSIANLFKEVQGKELANRELTISDSSSIGSFALNIAANTKFCILALSEAEGKINVSFKLSDNTYPAKIVTFNERMDVSFEKNVTNVYVTKNADTPASGSFELQIQEFGIVDTKADKTEIEALRNSKADASTVAELSLSKADKSAVEAIGGQVDVLSGIEIYNRTLTVGDSTSIANISTQIVANTRFSMFVESEANGQLSISFKLSDNTYPNYPIPYNDAKVFSFEKDIEAIYVQKNASTPQGDIRLEIRELGEVDTLNANVESISRNLSVYEVFSGEFEVEDETVNIFNDSINFDYDTTLSISLTGFGTVFGMFEYNLGSSGYKYVTSGRATFKVKKGLTSLNVRIYKNSIRESGTIQAVISANYLGLNKANGARMIGAIFYDGWKSAIYDNQAYGGARLSAISQDFYERSSIYDSSCPKWRDFILQETGETTVSQCSFSNYYPEEVAALQDEDGVNYPLLPSRKPMDAIEGVNMGWHNCDTQEQFDKQVEIAARYGLDYFAICVEFTDTAFFATTDTIDESGIHRTVIENENGNVTIDAVKFLDINRALKFMLNTTRRDLKFCIYILGRPTAGGNATKAKKRQLMMFEWIYNNVTNNINYMFVNSNPVILAYLHGSYGMDSLVCSNLNHFRDTSIVGSVLHRGSNGLCFYSVAPSKNGTYVLSPYSDIQDNMDTVLSTLTEINNVTFVPVMSGRGDMARGNFTSPGDWQQPTKAEFLAALEASINVAEAINRDDKMVLIYAWNEFTEGGWLMPTQYEYEQGIAFKKLEAISEAKEYWSNL